MLRQAKNVGVVQPVNRVVPIQRVDQRLLPPKYPKKKRRKRQDQLELIGQQQRQAEREKHENQMSKVWWKRL